jgi:hypothetical protein
MNSGVTAIFQRFVSDAKGPGTSLPYGLGFQPERGKVKEKNVAGNYYLYIGQFQLKVAL